MVVVCSQRSIVLELKGKLDTRALTRVGSK